jgi:CheY-like chemotaxis protein
VNVLVVDDDPDARVLLPLILESHGATARAASSVAEALSAIEEGLPDVLLADIGMPHEDGYSLIRKLRSGSQGSKLLLPAVAVTAYARASDREEALAAGYDGHLAKPVDPPDLIRAIAKLAGRA